jgi:hypothetical protein
MTNFKGTKGKWVINKNHQSIIDEDGFGIAIQYGHANWGEWDYDALLISKAPKMLEMLQKLIDNFDLHGNSNESENLILEAKQLIKEATEL